MKIPQFSILDTRRPHLPKGSINVDNNVHNFLALILGILFKNLYVALVNSCENFTLFSIISQLLIEIIFYSLNFCLADWHRICNMEFSSLQMQFWHFQINIGILDKLSIGILDKLSIVILDKLSFC